MAQRRMFAKTIIDSDAFLDMSLSTQALYFHLSMRADDDGFINNPKKIQRMIGCGDDELKMLIIKKFIIPFESGVCVIKHWRIHNYIRNDRYKETVYKDEKLMLAIKENGSYTSEINLGEPLVNQENTVGIPNGYLLDTQDRLELGKDRLELGKDRLELGKDNIYSEDMFIDILNYLNLKANTNYKISTKKTKDLIKARFNEKATIEDFKLVIDKKCKEWLGTDMSKYIRPETLFGTKFESYLNQKEVNENGSFRKDNKQSEKFKGYNFE